MTDSSNFFTDPKVMISLLALLIATISLIWSFANQWEQNRKWDNLNAGNPEIKKVRLIIWKELTKEDAMGTEWGYNPHIYGKGEASNQFIIPYHLTLRDAITNEIIPNINPIFTILEVEQELKRIEYKGNVIVYKLFKPKFEIENVGKTAVRELSILVDAKLPNQEWNRAFTSNTNINLNGLQKSTFYFSFELPIETILPEQISFKIHFMFINYKDEKVEKTIGAKWTTNDNFWSYEIVKE